MILYECMVYNNNFVKCRMGLCCCKFVVDYDDYYDDKKSVFEFLEVDVFVLLIYFSIFLL